MSDIKAFEKLYQVREQELDDARLNYDRALDHFEQEATKLYDLLKSKENVQAQLEHHVSSGIKVDQMAGYYNYLSMLEQQEGSLQKKVHQARLNMYKKQDAVQEAHQEVKKIDKIIEHKKEQQRELDKQAEASFLDEIAVQQYSRVK
ncbi:flagellar FliJ protein [Alkalibacillus flavidus]|uniref:Flagellar FliJ protein n=1 Tax=Alkalibacillus flavidus TaxID=546021 RepID=A0ABV2KU65_9BACI